MPLQKERITTKRKLKFRKLRDLTFKTVLDILKERTGKTEEEVMRKVNSKIEDLGHLISDVGAICIVAKEYGIDIFE